MKVQFMINTIIGLLRTASPLEWDCKCFQCLDFLSIRQIEKIPDVEVELVAVQLPIATSFLSGAYILCRTNIVKVGRTPTEMRNRYFGRIHIETFVSAQRINFGSLCGGWLLVAMLDIRCGSNSDAC